MVSLAVKATTGDTLSGDTLTIIHMKIGYVMSSWQGLSCENSRTFLLLFFVKSEKITRTTPESSVTDYLSLGLDAAIYIKNLVLQAGSVESKRHECLPGRENTIQSQFGKFKWIHYVLQTQSQNI